MDASRINCAIDWWLRRSRIDSLSAQYPSVNCVDDYNHSTHV